LLIFIAGTVVMRSAGCVINDFADRKIDRQVKRTRNRPLAARRMSPYAALWLFAALIACALALVWQLDALTVRYAFVGAALTISYPFMKRFFALPQLYLGAAFGWAIPMGFVALQGGVPRVGWVLFIVAVLWAGVYDTVYAMVDRDDDAKLDVHSTALLFGEHDRLIVAVLQALVLVGLVMTGRLAQLGTPFYVSLLGGAALFGWQQWLIRHRDRPGCFAAFTNNGWFGEAQAQWQHAALSIFRAIENRRCAFHAQICGEM
jgi:4-hydroxybenzoate polyprenyltransferase